MTIGDGGVSLEAVLKWLTVVVGGLASALFLRNRNSKDGADRANDSADKARGVAAAGLYDTALSDMTVDRNGWRDAHREIERLYRSSESQVARLTAMQETHVQEIQSMRDQHAREIAHLTSEVEGLRRMVRTFAPPPFRRALGPDFEGSQAGGLDDAKDGP